ncbi:proteasome assembly chaperone 4-like [Oratosquilla oratoria]|uniref:proteasome assembly chaperone 4-like n=1 Tax=Oratosquilla oratoria TaxID=337810 RepID=UPI003F767682
MAFVEDSNPNIRLEEFSSQLGDRTLYYQVLRMKECMYIWVGTEEGGMGDLTASMSSRIGPATSTLLGPATTLEVSQLAGRLHQRSGFQIFLSVNVGDHEVLPHVEEHLVEELCLA